MRRGKRIGKTKVPGKGSVLGIARIRKKGLVKKKEQ